MKNKVLIPLLVGGALAGFFSFKYIGGGEGAESNNATRRELVVNTVMRAIKDGHFAPRDINDSFSHQVFNKLMETLDYDKKFFTRQDMGELGVYRDKIDDQITNGKTEFFDKLNTLFTRNIDRADAIQKELLQTPFSFTNPETIEMNGEKLAYAADEAALKDRWRIYLKYRVLSKYVDLKKEQEKKVTDSGAKVKTRTDAELEADARESVRKNQETFFRRLRKLDENERFTLFVNTVTSTEDPHTDYFPPKEKQAFDEVMSGTFFGIGAQLKEEEGKIKVASIITGSPSWKQGELKAGDEIQKVAQGAAEPVDVQGFEIEDVVSKIRGKKGTEVRLTVKKVDGSVKVIPIIRGEVQLEETFAKSAIIKSPGGPVGYIYLREFYADFQHINGRRCAEDVAIEVQKLKNAGVTGIILDLRDNGGGSLSDVVDMSGLFIDQGPIVQVKSSDASPTTLRDASKGVLYDGPLAIMVNQGSASASEILAAAMQDYKRAVIVGSPTFGKGTVQKVISLDEYIDPITRMRMQSKGEGPIGALKLTVQKFYRVNGGSTQLRGVTPDIRFPDPYAMIEIGERKDKAALKWDEIKPADYKPTNSVNPAELAALSKKRTSANPAFTLIEESAREVKNKEANNTYVLTEQAYRAELEKANANSKKMEELQKKTTQLTITNPKEDQNRINMDASSKEKNSNWIKNLQKDIYLAETVNIINDMARPSMKVNMATGMKY